MIMIMISGVATVRKKLMVLKAMEDGGIINAGLSISMLNTIMDSYALLVLDTIPSGLK